MSIEELEQAVARLSTEELTEFARSFNDFHHEQWDKQILAGSQAGSLDKLIQKAQQDFEAGRLIGA